MCKKIMMVFGTRPEATKMAPLYQSLKDFPDEFNTFVCVTAQHRQMLDQVLKAFNIEVDLDLNLMSEDQDLFDLTSSILLSIRKTLKEFKPDIVLVHGDTTTAFATSMACFYLNLPVWHVEAGLRTNNLRAPFPEEFNRQIISKLTDVHLAPTKLAKQNLLKEGVEDAKILVTGNTVIDALYLTLNQIESNQEKKQKIVNSFQKILPFDLEEKYILITGHRRENFGKGFSDICKALQNLALKYPEIKFIYPVHLNPKVQGPVNDLIGKVNNIYLIPPLDYEAFTFILKKCYLILTDSGGIQEEAPSLGKPVLVMRDVTERPEAVDSGTVRLVGTDKKTIFDSVSELLDNEEVYLKMASSINPYGDGNACGRIISALKTD